MANQAHQCEGTVDASNGPPRHQGHLSVHCRNSRRQSHQRPYWSQQITTDSRRPQTHRRLVCHGLAQCGYIQCHFVNCLVKDAKHLMSHLLTQNLDLNRSVRVVDRILCAHNNSVAHCRLGDNLLVCRSSMCTLHVFIHSLTAQFEE